MKFFSEVSNRCIKSVTSWAQKISSWWLSLEFIQMFTIAILCASGLSLILVFIHRVLSGRVSEIFADIVMLSIITIILLLSSALITSVLKSKQQLDKLRIHLEEVSVRDPLTNLYNRRFLTEELNRFRKRLIRDLKEGKVVSLVLIFMDMDKFKDVNDKYGHKAGDDALCFTARLLEAEIRDGEDFFSRYGGDEFCEAIIVRNYKTTYEMLRQIASATRRIKRTMKKALFFSGAQRIPLSITIGIHIVNVEEPNIMAELAKADAKMYEKKKRHKAAHTA